MGEVEESQVGTKKSDRSIFISEELREPNWENGDRWVS